MPGLPDPDSVNLTCSARRLASSFAWLVLNCTCGTRAGIVMNMRGLAMLGAARCSRIVQWFPKLPLRAAGSCHALRSETSGHGPGRRKLQCSCHDRRGPCTAQIPDIVGMRLGGVGGNCMALGIYAVEWHVRSAVLWFPWLLESPATIHAMEMSLSAATSLGIA